MVELVGPAGAGKSALAQSLMARRPRELSRVSVWRRPLPLLAKHALRVLPTALAMSRRGFWPGWMGFAQMARVGAVLEQITAILDRGDRAVVVDEGPLFCFAWFRVFYARHARDVAFQKWASRMEARYADLLDMALFLDASNSLLIRRIRDREQPHMVKHACNAEIRRFAARFRWALEAVLAAWPRETRLRLRRLRLRGDEPLDAVRDQALLLMGIPAEGLPSD